MTGEPTGTPAPEPAADVLSADCPARRVLAVIGDKWTPVVIYLLSGGMQHFGELRRRIPDISRKVLTQVLRALEREGLVSRTVLAAAVPRTEYRLTEAGRHLHEPVALLCHWANRNIALLDAVDRAREGAGPP